LLALAIVVLVIDAVFGDRGLVEMVRARHDYHQLAASIARLRTDNARLREEARRLREDPSAIEELARRELGLIRPGELLFIVKDRTFRSTAP
jgi:cell division protein FtsB